MKPLGPHSRPGKLAIIDGRSAEARLMKRVRDDLAEHLGGNVSATQRMIINRIAMLQLRVELMDRNALRGGDQTERDQRQYLAWCNTISKLLRHLGLKGAAPREKTLADHLRDRAA